jgi:ABC-type bacteriocin/lantibiotic exporter with double-glycine peptidase domain
MSDKPKKVTATRVFAAGTVLALIISIPSIAVTLVMHYIIKTNLIITMGAGLITLFIAMGFGYKISKKLTTRVQNGGSSSSSHDGQDLEKMK